MTRAVLTGVGILSLMPVLLVGALTGALQVDPSLAIETDPAVLADVSALQEAVLTNPNIGLSVAARVDVRAGRLDPRVLATLLVLARSHHLSRVGPLIGGHATYVRGTRRVSNHVHGRAVDITGIEDAPVSRSNPAAREVMQDVIELASPLRPDELGGPWLVGSKHVRVFTKDHGDHLHIGYKTPFAGSELPTPTSRSPR